MPKTATTATLLDDVDISPLFQPVQLTAGLNLQNRLAMAPMTRMRCPGGVPTRQVGDYYERRAQSLGLIITEGVYIDHESAGTSANVPTIYGGDAMSAWAEIVERVHAKGAKIFPQIWHLGGIRRAGSEPFPDASVVTPSGISPHGKQIGEPATKQTLEDIAQSFGRAAASAFAAGFDGVEIHGAHGYLLDQFLWDETNRRDDEYGGTVGGRVKLSVDVVEAIRAQVPADFPVQFRFSQWKGGRYDAQIAKTQQELEEILVPLADAGVDIFHASARRYWEPAFAGSPLTISGWTKKITGKPVVTVGSVGVGSQFLGADDDQQPTLSLRRLMELYEQDDFDLVAVGRALLSEPLWAEYLQKKTPQQISAYTKDSEATYF